MNNELISIIIPTYKEPAYLDLCLYSLFIGQRNFNEVVVVVDGFEDINRAILDKYKDFDGFNVLIFNHNVGLQAATNAGVWKASNEKILIVNDDNVFPADWDYDLNHIDMDDLLVVSPNQMEPNPSIFDEFVIRDFGKTAEDFDYQAFINETNILHQKYGTVNGNGCRKGYTLPIFMTKAMYMTVGGWDTFYSSPHVCDMDFFLKLILAGCNFRRAKDVVFYHFGGKATIDPIFSEKEKAAHKQFGYKWGFMAARNTDYSIKNI